MRSSVPLISAKPIARPTAQPPVARRSYEGAAPGRRWHGVPEMASAVGAQIAAAPVLARRARALVANNAHAYSGVEAWVSALVGTGLKVQSGNHPALATAFEGWTDYADADRLTDFYGLQAAAVRGMVINGEAFALLNEYGEIRLIDPEQVDRSLSRDIGGGARIVNGVEFARDGRRVAYHIRQDTPGLPFAISYETIRVPAAQVLHLFRPLTAGQVRGVSWLAPVLLRLADYDAAIDAQLVRQKTAALFAGFVSDAKGDTAGFDGVVKEPVLQAELEPGTLSVLGPGQDIRFSEPAAIGAEAIGFLKITRSEIAAGLGIPNHVLSGDLSDANYGSLRAGLIEWRRRVEAIQHGVIVFQFCRPVWVYWLLRRALSGSPEMGGFFRDQALFENASWITPRFDWIDPLKDAEAEIAAIGAGLMSRRQAVAARGYDVEKLDEEIAADNARAAKLGLAFNTSKPRAIEQGVAA